MDATTNKKIPLGHIKTISLHLDNPKMAVDNMDMKSFHIMVGQNGTGKSLVLAMSWYLSWVANSIVVRYNNKMVDSIPGVENMICDVAQYGADRTFDTKLTGTVDVEFTGGLYIKLTFNQGKCEDVFYSGNTVNMSATHAIFMSSSMRTFENMSMYCKFRKQKITPGTPPEKIILDMSEDFKLYDVMYVEKLISRCPITVDQRLTVSLHGFIGKEKADEIKIIGFDEAKCDFWTGNGVERKYCTTYSKGEQALINMMIGSGLN